MFVFTFYFSNDAEGLRPMPMGQNGGPGPGGPGGGFPGRGGPEPRGPSPSDGGEPSDDGDGPGPHRRKTEKPEKTPEKGGKRKALVKDAKTTKATKDGKTTKDAKNKKMTDAKNKKMTDAKNKDGKKKVMKVQGK